MTHTWILPGFEAALVMRAQLSGPHSSQGQTVFGSANSAHAQHPHLVSVPSLIAKTLVRNVMF